MPNRRLSIAELGVVREILSKVRAQIEAAANGDAELLFAINRKVYKELSYDERDTPARRMKLKGVKRREQNGICPYCNLPLPAKYCELDRITASAGYTAENTRLVHGACHVRSQAAKGYA